MVGIYRRGDKHVAVTARQPPLEPGETLPTKRYQQIRRVAQPAVRYNDDRVRDIRLTRLSVVRCARRLGKGGSDVGGKVETFQGTLWVINPARQSLASSRKRVLRPNRATVRTKRRQ